MTNQLFSSTQENTTNLRVSVCHDRALICRLINEWHSWRKAPQGWRVAFILTDGLVIYGVSTFGRPVARMEDQLTTLEHTRMALSNDAPPNSASFFMARTRQWIKKNMPDVNRLISYISEDVCTGVTYRADNWKIVYEHVKEPHRWTNRHSRCGVACKHRTKFERKP